MDKRPEDYWIGRGEDLIGLDVLDQQKDCRQASTYSAIAAEVWLCGYTTVLDIGCNVGALEMFLGTRVHDIAYTGIDTNPHAVAFCKEKGIRAYLGSLRDMQLVEPTFDCVVVKDVLEHLESLEPAREAFRTASLCVILSFFMPPHPGVQVIHQTENGYFHNVYDENTLWELAGSCGFDLDKRIDTWEKGGGPMNRTYVFLRRVANA